MQHKILFSIAVHESEGSVRSLLTNIFKFNDNVAVVLHLAHDFCFYFSENEFSGDIYVNPKSYRTGYADQSLGVIHTGNLYYADSIGLDAEYFAIVGSNEMFIKPGCYDYIKEQNHLYIPPYDKNDYHVKHALNDPDFMRLMSKFSVHIVKSPPEGNFYSYRQLLSIVKKEDFKRYFIDIERYFTSAHLSLVRTVINYTTRFLTVKLKVPISIIPGIMSKFSYASEEVLFPSLMETKIGDSNSYCHMDFDNNLYVTRDVIDKLLIKNDIFSTKRIDRKVDDDIRVYIDNMS